MYRRDEVQKKREARRKLGEDMRAINELAAKENRDLTPEENERFDKMHDDGLKLLREIERMEKVSGMADTGASNRNVVVDPEADPAAPADAPEAPADEEMRSAGKGPRDTKEYVAMFRAYLSASDRHQADAILARAHAFRAEHRDLQVDSDTQAGYLVPPEQFVMELLKNLDNEQIVRGFARTFQVRQAKSLGVVKRTAAASTWTRGTEIQTPTKDSALAYGKRELYPHDAAGEIVVSRNFLRQALIPGEQIVREELARGGGELLEQEYMTGSGAAGQGLGVFTASADGISTSRDVATDNTATAVTVGGLRAAKYAIKAAYWPRLRWVGSRTFHKQLYGMSDGIGRPLFVESLRVGEPDLCMGFPVHISEFAPSTFTTGQYVAILGDWSFYWIADALDIELQRLDELYARTHQVGFIARLKSDSMPVLEECWSRVKLG